MICKYFPPFCRLSFYFIHGVIWAIEFLILRKSSLLFFYFVTCTCGDIFKNWGHKGLPLLLFKNCLHLSLWFILNFFCMFWGRGPEWFPCIWRSSCPSTIHWKDNSFHIQWSCNPCQKLVHHGHEFISITLLDMLEKYYFTFIGMFQ